MAKLLRLVERGIVALVDRANDAQLGLLVRALCAEHPDLRVVTEAPHIEELPPKSVIVLATRPKDAAWLNSARPVFAERALRLVLWSKSEVTAELARRAPDFFDWIERRLDCPAGPPRFAIAGLRAALRARAWAVAFRGRTLSEVFEAALPRRKLVSANTALSDAALLAAAKEAGRAWIAWSYVIDDKAGRRVRRIATEAGRRGRNILENPFVDVDEAQPVSDAIESLDEGVAGHGVVRHRPDAGCARLAPPTAVKSPPTIDRPPPLSRRILGAGLLPSSRGLPQREHYPFKSGLIKCPSSGRR